MEHAADDFFALSKQEMQEARQKRVASNAQTHIEQATVYALWAVFEELKTLNHRPTSALPDPSGPFRRT